MSQYVLYGDGKNDDTLAIQELLDSGVSEVFLPAPKKNYCISKTLKIHSNQTLHLGETTLIKLLPNSSCPMLANAENGAHDISIIGGIWDYDNLNQEPNPICAKKEFIHSVMHTNGDPNNVVTYDKIGYLGVVIRFFHVTRFRASNMTIKNPVTFCLQLAYVTHFTIENIFFDQNFGNPTAENMDGIHIDGGCRFGSIRNVQGTCYDDIVALNADDCYDGPISDISIDGVYGENSLRGVRLLSIKSLVSNISISNVFGTFYQNCIGLTYFYPKNELRGKMSHVSIKNVYGKNAHRIPEYQKGDDSFFRFAFVWIDGSLDIDSVTIDNLFRNEEISHVETIKVCNGAKIKRLSLSNIVHQNSTDTPITFMVNEGEIENLYMHNVDTSNEKLLDNKGVIGSIIETSK